MSPRSSLAARASAVAAGSRRSRGVRIGLLAIAAVVVRGDEARGQVGVESDREVLEAFYHATGGPDWFFNTNWLSDAPLSEWYGVSTNEQGRVERLTLQRNNLTGALPPELPRLTSLQYLSLLFNQLSGPISPELGQMTGLRALILFDNQLSGPIPPELGQLTNLTLLHLDQNQLTGPIPPELGQLTALSTILGLASNQLTGPIPPELGRLTNLERLQLQGNQLSGPIPPELGQLTSLEWLSLSSNQLSGPIPPELGQMTRLKYLQLQGNQLSGPIPVEFGNLTALTLLRIDSDTGLCLPPEIQDTVFGLLALQQSVPLCAAVTTLPLAALLMLATALVVLGLRRNGYGEAAGRVVTVPARDAPAVHPSARRPDRPRTAARER